MTSTARLSCSAPHLPPLIGCSAAIETARSRIERFAATGIPVLLVGPTGAGKEVVARHVHAASGRPGELVDVNCGALPQNMIETLLFGHRRGAFTGAVESTVGLICRAHGGTLFLDELASLPAEGQAALLRVLETGEVRPLGGGAKQRADFRLVAAVQDDVFVRIEQLRFRADLYFRINGVAIHLPPLSARPEDIEPLARHFTHLQHRTIDVRALAFLSSQRWPGNVRELRAVVERACVLTEERTICEAAIIDALNEANRPAAHEAPGRAESGDPATQRRVRASTALAQRTARARLTEVCVAHGFKADEIAAALGISRATLFRRLRLCGLSLTALRVSWSLTESQPPVRLGETE
jgi:DNA-binding NtrC family response regulator